MKKTLPILLSILLLSSCGKGTETNSETSSLISTPSTASTVTSVVPDSYEYPYDFFPFRKSFGVYGDYRPEFPMSPFDQTLLDNPIDKKMKEEFKTQAPSSTFNLQVFYDGYIGLWQKELEFSIQNLKTYLTEVDKSNLEASQKAWEENWKLNSKFDMELMGNRGINLGTQYVGNGLIYLIEQYRCRVFHIKYMTMLAEESIADAVPEEEQLWDKFREV